MLSTPILRGKEDISRNWRFKVSLPTSLGNNCSLIKFSHISEISVGTITRAYRNLKLLPIFKRFGTKTSGYVAVDNRVNVQERVDKNQVHQNILWTVFKKN